MTTPIQPITTDPFAALQAATRRHLAEHGCGAYTFEDGPALRDLANQRQPNRILELGTALGYTACCLAHGSPQAKIDTIEGDAQHVELARAQISQYGLSANITVHHGAFDAVLGTLRAGYDFAFFDGFAPALNTLRRMRELLTTGGLLACSNLQLSSGDEARQITDALTDSSRWTRCDPIENGRTVVLIKLAA